MNPLEAIRNLFSSPEPIQAPPTKRFSSPSSSVKTVAHRYDQLGHRVADLATEQSLGYGQMSGDATSRYDRQTLVSVERQVYDENIVFSSMLDRVVTNLTGPDGFTLQARTKDSKTNEIIEKEIWPEFTRDPEYRGLFDWTEVQQGVMAEILGPGDVGFVKLANGQLQAIENERINSPQNSQFDRLPSGGSIEQGIELTRGGKVVAFWVANQTQEGYGQEVGNGRRIPKENFIYVHGGLQRFSRTRPLPPWIQVMSCIWRFDDILNSEAIAWQLLSKHAIAVTKQDADKDANDLSETDDYAPTTAPVADRITEHGSATIFWGEDGEGIEGINRNLPGKDFPASVRSFMQLFAMRVGLPLEILLLDWSKTNFSSGRAALNQATNMIRRYQKAVLRRFHIEVYRWKIQQAIAQGKLKEIDSIFNHEWFPPSLPWANPKEDAEAWGVQIDRGLVTYSDALKHQGKDRDEQNLQRMDDFVQAIEFSKLIEQKTGVPVPWQYFAGLTVGKTESAFKSTEKSEPDADEDPNAEDDEDVDGDKSGDNEDETNEDEQ